MSLAIACASGGYRVAFIQGVLTVLEREGIRADVYAGTSGSVIPAALAAITQHEQYALKYIMGLLEYKSLGKGMSGAFLESIRVWEPLIQQQLFQPGRPRLVVPVSAVMTQEAAAKTQGTAFRRLGRKLLLASGCRRDDWATTNLNLELFDTHASDPDLRLTPDNFSEVAYASSRMLHAWRVPAWINRLPYIDASYTCSCPALELAAMGYDEVIAITPEVGPFYHDLLSRKVISSFWRDTPIHIIQPDVDLQEFGVQYTQATEKGLRNAYQLGEEKGDTFLAEWQLCPVRERVKS